MRSVIVVVGFVACSSPEEPIIPTGDHYQFVVTHEHVPKHSTEARMYGVDVDGHEGPDNQAGMVMGTIAGQGIELQGFMDDQIFRGEAITLIDIQTTSFLDSEGVGVALYTGRMPTPMACDEAGSCGHHLDGNATFLVDETTAPSELLVGRFDEHGELLTRQTGSTMRIPLAALDGIYTHHNARVRLRMVDGQLEGVIGGALEIEEIRTYGAPFFATQLNRGVALDCTALDDPNGTPACGCSPESLGHDILNLFDVPPKDCHIVVDEVLDNGLVQSLIAADVIADGQDCLSVGLQANFVPAHFTLPVTP